MLLGTTTGVMPVVDVDGRRMGDGQPGSLTLQLQRELWSMMNAAP
jgi:branched-chain amino acid aminotransferase